MDKFYSRTEYYQLNSEGETFDGWMQRKRRLDSKRNDDSSSYSSGHNPLTDSMSSSTSYDWSSSSSDTSTSSSDSFRGGGGDFGGGGSDSSW